MSAVKYHYEKRGKTGDAHRNSLLDHKHEHNGFYHGTYRAPDPEDQGDPAQGVGFSLDHSVLQDVCPNRIHKLI